MRVGYMDTGICDSVIQVSGDLAIHLFGDSGPLRQPVNEPRAVLAAAPRDERLLHGNRSGCSVPARRFAARTILGPGMTNSSPTSRWTRFWRTAGTAGKARHTPFPRQSDRPGEDSP